MIQYMFRGSMMHDNNAERIDKAVQDGIKQFYKKYKELPINIIFSSNEPDKIEYVRINDLKIPVVFSPDCPKGYSYYFYKE